MRVAQRVTVIGWNGLEKHERLDCVAPIAAGTSIHAVAERCRPVEALGAVLGSRRLAYRVSERERQGARDWLTAQHAGHLKPLIGLQLSSFPTKAQRDWPLASFRELMAALLGAKPACGFVILGDGRARELAAPLAAAFPRHVLIAAGSTSLRQTAALIEQLDLYLGVDTGPTHIAGALEVPMVAMYHADFPGRNLCPLDRQDCIVIEHPATGQPNRGAAARMADIAVDQVLRAVLGLCEGIA